MDQNLLSAISEGEVKIQHDCDSPERAVPTNPSCKVYVGVKILLLSSSWETIMASTHWGSINFKGIQPLVTRFEHIRQQSITFTF